MAGTQNEHRMDAENPLVGPLQQQTVQMPLPPATQQVEPRQKYKNVLYGFGVTEVVFGCVSILLAILTVVIAAETPTYLRESYYYSPGDRQYEVDNYFHGFTFSAQGIWCGAFLITIGVLGIKTKKNPSVCMYNANMALSIITACFMIPLMVLSGLAAGITGYGNYRPVGLVAIHSTVAIIGFVATILCIVHSAYCCAGVCCRRKHRGVVVYAGQPYATQQAQQMVQVANGQFVMIPCQPAMYQGTAKATLPAGQGPISVGNYQAPQTSTATPLQSDAQTTFASKDQEKANENQPPVYRPYPSNHD